MPKGVAGLLGALLLPATLAPTPTGQPAGQGCRIMATAFTTRATARGFSAETETACTFDRTALKSTCTSRYRGGRGTSSTTTTVTTFGSIADALEEVRVVPPLRRSLRSESTIKGSGPTTTSTLVNVYDARNRLVREDASSSPGPGFTTTYTTWDQHGRPTAGRTVSKGTPASTLALKYNDAARTLTITTESHRGRADCDLTFDANGNLIGNACRGPAGPSGSSKMTITATQKICP